MKRNQQAFQTQTPDSCVSSATEKGSCPGINFADNELYPAKTVQVPICDGLVTRQFRLCYLHKSAGLISDAEKHHFNEKFLSPDNASGRVLLWRELRRCDPSLFSLLLYTLS